MKLNRRKFLKFLGKAAVVSSVAVATRLPEVREIETFQSLPSDIWGSGWEPEKIAKWDGHVWGKLKSTNLEKRHLTIDKDEILHTGSVDFTPP